MNLPVNMIVSVLRVLLAAIHIGRGDAYLQLLAPSPQPPAEPLVPQLFEIVMARFSKIPIDRHIHIELEFGINIAVRIRPS